MDKDKNKKNKKRKRDKDSDAEDDGTAALNVPQKIDEVKELDDEPKGQESEESNLRNRGKGKAAVASQEVEEATNASNGHDDDEEHGDDDKQ